MRSLGMKLLAFAAVAMLSAPVFAQTDTYGSKADVALELRPSKLINSPLGQKMGFKSQLEAMSSARPDSPDFSKLDRIFAGLVAPADVENLEKVQQGQQNDMQFFARLEFSTAEAATKMIAQALEDNSGVVEKNGKKYYKAPAGKGMPDGTVMFQPSEKIVEVASEGFAYRTNAMPFTDALPTAWKTLPDEALKLSIDGVNARALLKGLAEEGKKNAGGDPMAGAVMDLFPTMDNINLSIDLASANLLTMTMVGGDEEKAGDINDAFKSVMTIAKPAAMGGLAALEAQAPEPAAVFGKVVSGMDVKQAGKAVTLHLPRPEGFADATVEAVPVIQGLIFQMMMGGMGGGPGGPGGPPSGDF